MNFLQFVNVQYCYSYLIDQIPVGLLIYSHIPTALLAIIFGVFVLITSRKLPSVTLFIVALFFAFWCFADLASWFAFLGSGTVMFAWSLSYPFNLIFAVFSYYFLYTFLYEEDLPLWQKAAGTAILTPTFIWTYLNLNLSSFDANTCEAIENSYATNYLFAAQGLVILATACLVYLSYKRAITKESRSKIILAGSGVLFLLVFFLTSTVLASIMANSAYYAEYAYNYEIYGLFGMPILLIYLGYLIVRYKAFDLRIFGTQALIFALIAVLASQFAFATSLTNRILVSITLILTGFVGTILVRSVRREIALREHVELLAKDLEVANNQQVALIHFITHQLKGFVAKSRNIFAMIQEGDYGTVPDTMKPMIDEGFSSATKGAQTIQDILNASNIKSGKMAYAMAPFDFKSLVDSIVKLLKPNADAKGVEITFDEPVEPVMFTGDQMQLENAIKNMVDNTIKYTPKGSIKISLTNDGKTIRFITKDTGVGITTEDMKRLFTEGGHGAESQKVNVDSTGFGLYIVKNIIEGHRGKVWAESEGAGKGSTFIVELPVSA